MQHENDLLTPEQAAAYLDISPITFYRRLREKGIKPTNYNPMRKRQKDPRFSKVDLDKIKEDFLLAVYAA